VSWGEYLFSFKGRINRLRYWQFALVSAGFIVAGLIVLVPYMDYASSTTGPGGQPLSPFSSVFGVVTIAIIVVLFVALIVASFAISVKRLHDRNKSAWWVLVFLVLPGVLDPVARGMSQFPDRPSGVALLLELANLVLSLWAFIELGCLKGTDGPNRYGTDPLKGASGEVATVFE
jgi:uncharacterized membrane protein YhaH (DUF805 family)